MCFVQTGDKARGLAIFRQCVIERADANVGRLARRIAHEAGATWDETDAIEDPRTHVHILRDVLELAIEGEWSGTSWEGCHCHGHNVPACAKCDALKEDGAGEHKTGCAWVALVESARAYLRAENTIIAAEDNGWPYRSEVFVP